MGKKKSNAANAARDMESKVSPILEITYPDPLFSVAAHPTKPIIVQGLATGHIFCTEYNAEKLEEKQQESRDNFIKEQQEAFKKGKFSSVIKSVSQSSHKWWNVINDISSVNDPLVKTLWKTKRHKGSCRSIIFDPLEGSLGENIYSVGTDHVIKKANTETGKVCGKVDISRDYIDDTDSATKLCHSATHNMLLAGTEGGHVLVYDSSNLSKSKIKFKVPNVHDDCINHILPMPDVSAYHYLTVGSTTLSHIDVRKGIVTQSDDQEDELLSMCYASDHVNDHKNDVVLVSHGEGIVTIWKNSKNHWRDQLSRIKVNKGVSLDAIVPSMNCDSEEMTNSIWCGDADGLLHRINYKMGKVVETRVHSNTAVKYGAVDEVSVLDIDYNYRLISSGMDSLKIWSEQVQDDIIEESSEDDSDDESISGDEFSSDMESDVSIEVKEEADSSIEDVGSSDLSGSEEQVNNNSGNDDDDHSTDSSDHDTEDATIEIKRKKRIISSIKPKRKLVNLNKESSTPEETSESKKIKTKQLTNKQLRNMQQHEHGIRKFDDL